MRVLRVDKYIIETPIIEILEKLQRVLTNGKLRDIKPSGDNIVVTCPIHSGGHEKKGACNIYIGNDLKLDYGFFRCFVCESKGSFIQFLAACFDSSEDFAKQWLIKNFGVLSENAINLGADINIGQLKMSKTKNYVPLDTSILETYQKWHPYLAKRKISQEVCNLFNIRYDPKNRQIVFPCYSIYGDLIMTPRRSIDFKQFYIDKEVEKPLYCFNEVYKRNINKIMIVEGLFDTLSCWTHNVPAVGTLGAFSLSQIDTLNKSNITIIYTAFDKDKWGVKFRDTFLKLINKRILVINIDLPENRKDVAELTSEEWDELIKKYNLPQEII